jgi:hypothetical protein
VRVSANAGAKPEPLLWPWSDDHWVTVRLWRPVGRVRDGEVRCPPLALRKVAGRGSI